MQQLLDLPCRLFLRWFLVLDRLLFFFSFWVVDRQRMRSLCFQLFLGFVEFVILIVLQSVLVPYETWHLL